MVGTFHGKINDDAVAQNSTVLGDILDTIPLLWRTGVVFINVCAMISAAQSFRFSVTESYGDLFCFTVALDIDRLA
ncbi:MAG: hypothetical protein OXD40_00300 [bacterium]|nr:hypothetical protein [bacterium]